MPLMICPKCTKFHYVPGDCPQPRSTAALTEVPVQSPKRAAQRKLGSTDVMRVNTAAGTQAPPVETKPRNADRHKPGYQAAKQREYRERRARLKAEK
jgi:hypothetical protein